MIKNNNHINFKRVPFKENLYGGHKSLSYKVTGLLYDMLSLYDYCLYLFYTLTFRAFKNYDLKMFFYYIFLHK